MTRMIERWFPCQEVSEGTAAGWGTGNSEKNLFTWFAARPLAQAKAAVICSLLPWPDDLEEQRRLQELVRGSLMGRDAKHDELVAEIAKTSPNGASLLDPYSGRAMIPLEAARLGVRTWGIDYSPVATLGGSLLADYPLRDWSSEPSLPFDGYDTSAPAGWGSPRLLRDTRFILELIADRHDAEVAEFYPAVRDVRPWGYLWAVTLPCQNCGNRFPLTGSLVLRYPLVKKDDPGQSYRIVTDVDAGTFVAEVHDGPPTEQPSLVAVKGRRGKVAICSFCMHVHSKDVHARLMSDQMGRDELLVVGDLHPRFGKSFRDPTDEEFLAVARATKALEKEDPFAPGLPAIPDERVPPGNNHTVRPSLYGYTRYSSFMNDRQVLSLVRLCRVVDSIAEDMLLGGVSPDYVSALAGYAGAVLVRCIRRAGGRSITLQPRTNPAKGRVNLTDMFTNEASIAFSYDFFEVGLTDAAGSWRSGFQDPLRTLGEQLARPSGRAATILRGSAASLPMPDGSLDAVVTDPPYDSMIDYSDASDLFYVWLKRALVTSHPDLGMTSHPLGVQEKDEEAIVKDSWKSVGDHRDEHHYDRCISAAFTQARRKVKTDGVVTIVFGHGDPDVWHRLLTAIDAAGLTLTGSWPARTESGGKAGSANIETTLTLACRPAPPERPVGRVAEVDAEVRREIMDRIPLWDAAGLALTDQLMASAGPAMEVVGRYAEVRDKTGQPVDLDRYLPLARRFVEEAADIKIDTLPLETFDARTRFALFWVKVHGRGIAAGSEARWQRLASDLSDGDTTGVVVKDGKGVRLAFAAEAIQGVTEESPVIDVALAVANAGKSVAGAAEILARSGRTEDAFVWAAMGELARSVPEADRDGEVWTWVVRNRSTIIGASRNIDAARVREDEEREAAARQGSLFGGDG